MKENSFFIQFSIPGNSSFNNSIVMIRAVAELDKQENCYWVHSYQSIFDEIVFNFPEIKIKQIQVNDKPCWIHSDSEIPSALSIAAGKGIEACISKNTTVANELKNLSRPADKEYYFEYSTLF